MMSGSVEALCRNLGEDQKEAYHVHAKHSKAIAKRFKADIASDPVQNVILDQRPLVDQAIVMHLLRQGDFANAEAFAREASVARDDKLWDAFKVLYEITTSLSRGELSDAIPWARARREHLQQRRSSLEFNLHKAQYIRIYQT
ncbi:hypothetical protein BCR37DRAFT_219487 [Protomyces lactucae-debilis]|uniref:CTLH domain-containing protein n=1 Tax=Protomyces lactucae-debilis TaxID=2754530 RepID=A0A1Y2FQZ1_PROLT|nr:uncharacterized protein BCR37DRAFT_219487 [Protomyces lactucae-debilis]ORY86388.1 hypothetical protein BCR37DRAFT_219487 [Protomyces lactucae-debilis]